MLHPSSPSNLGVDVCLPGQFFTYSQRRPLRGPSARYGSLRLKATFSNVIEICIEVQLALNNKDIGPINICVLPQTIVPFSIHNIDTEMSKETSRPHFKKAITS